MNSETVADFENGMFSTIFKSYIQGFGVDEADVGDFKMEDLRYAVNAQMQLMELEAFHGKPKPCHYAGDPSFGSMQ